jgi:hypothetical protein
VSTNPDVIRVANCSGFYGDRLSAAREMVGGGPIDVLTGDYLAELTMAILYAKKAKDPSGGFVGTFLKQVKEVLVDCIEKDIKIVTNAGGLNPSAMAEAIEAIAHGKAGESQVVGKTIDAIDLPKGATISALVRGDTVMQGHHDTVVEEGDHVILFMTNRRQISDVERLFQTDA